MGTSASKTDKSDSLSHGEGRRKALVGDPTVTEFKLPDDVEERQEYFKSCEGVTLYGSQYIPKQACFF